MFETHVWKLPVKKFGYSKVAGLPILPLKSAGSQVLAEAATEGGL